MKNILITTDFSDNAWNALIYTLKLYKYEYCTFYLLNAYWVSNSNLSNIMKKQRSSMLYNAMRENSIENLNKLEEQVNKINTNENHTFKTLSSSAYLTTAVNEAIDKFNIDLVVMGTKGATGAREIFMGSNTVSVIKDTIAVPILTVPENVDFSQPKTIVFSTDFNRIYSSTELYPLTELAELYNSKIRVIHIKQEEELDKNQQINKNVLAHHLEDFEVSFHWLPYTESKEETIVNFVKDMDANVLAMINYQHSFIEKITREPVIKKLGFHALVPFLVMPNLS